MIKSTAPVGGLLLALAATVFSSPTHAQTGDAAAGRKIAAMCIGCHGMPGYQATFPEIYKVPKIAGQTKEYLVVALNAYKKGERKHPTMRGVSISLSDADMANLAAYYEQEGASMVKPVAETPTAAPSAEVAALLTKGACVSCHGTNFNKPINAAYPKIAGQHADYLLATLRAYGTENNPQVGRANGVMAAQVKPFTRRELKAMADYIGSLPGDLRTVRQPPFKLGSRPAAGG
jgi:cytochrome c553